MIELSYNEKIYKLSKFFTVCIIIATIFISIVFSSNDEVNNTIDDEFTKLVNEYGNNNANNSIDKESLTSIEEQEKIEQEINNKIAESKQNSEENKDYNGEINKLKLLQAKYPDNNNINKAIIELQDNLIEYIIFLANEFSALGNYIESIDTLNQGLSIFPNNSILETALDIAKTNYRFIILNNAETAFSNDGYMKAIEVINSAIVILGDDSDLLNAIVKYEQYKPIFALSIPYHTLGWNLTNISTITDNYNNIQENAFCLWGSYDIFLNGNYERLTGTIFKNFDNRSYEYADPYIKIYCDDNLVYNKTIFIGEIPTDFSIDLTNVKILKFEIKTITDAGRHLGGISNLYLYKKWNNE